MHAVIKEIDKGKNKRKKKKKKRKRKEDQRKCYIGLVRASLLLTTDISLPAFDLLFDLCTFLYSCNRGMTKKKNRTEEMARTPTTTPMMMYAVV